MTQPEPHQPLPTSLPSFLQTHLPTLVRLHCAPQRIGVSWREGSNAHGNVNNNKYTTKGQTAVDVPVPIQIIGYTVQPTPPPGRGDAQCLPGISWYCQVATPPSPRPGPHSELLLLPKLSSTPTVTPSVLSTPSSSGEAAPSPSFSKEDKQLGPSLSPTVWVKKS